MVKPATVPTTFATLPGGATPVSLLDNNFTAIASVVNDLGTYTNFATDSGSPNQYEISYAPPITVSLTDGLIVEFRSANTNTGASTLTINTFSAFPVLRPDGTPTQAGDIPANRIVSVIFDALGGAFYLMTMGAIPTGSAGSVTYQSPLSLAVSRSVQSRLQETVSVKDFGAVGNGVTDDTVALNNAMTGAYLGGKMLFWPSGIYMVREFSPGVGYAILNPGVSCFGEGMTHTQIMPLPSMPNTANFMLIQPGGGAFLDFIFIRDMFFQPTNSGTKYGATCLYWNTQTSSNISNADINGVYCAPGNAYSMIFNNNGSVNTQGIPAEMLCSRCAFWEGVQHTAGGDSNRYYGVTFRSTAGSTRVGLQYNAVGTAGNAPSCLSVQECNFDCSGGAVTLFGSYQASIHHNNIECSSGAGSGSGAIVDIDGSEIFSSFAEVTNNLVSIFGTSTATSGVRVNNALGTIIDMNRFLTGLTPNQAILITANSTGTFLGYNEIASGYVVPVTDLGGIGTRGLHVQLTLQNGWGNVGGGFATAAAIMHKEGQVQLEGTLSNAGSASGTIVLQLPLAFRPPAGHTYIAFGVIGGVISPIKLVLDVSGNITMSSSGTVTQLSLDNITYDTNSYIISSA